MPAFSAYSSQYSVLETFLVSTTTEDVFTCDEENFRVICPLDLDISCELGPVS